MDRLKETVKQCLHHRIPLPILFLSLHQVYYQLVVIRPVILHCKPNSRYQAFLRQALPILNENYWPTFWCFESRLQTILASIVRSTLPDIRYRREVSKTYQIYLFYSFNDDIIFGTRRHFLVLNLVLTDELQSISVPYRS
jgi:hypothetical protein